VRARNGAPNEIYGGPGEDVANLDSCDRPHNIQVPRWATKPCPTVTDSRRLSGVAPAYPYTPPRLACERDAAGRPLIRFVAYPVVRAVDMTARVDWQSVAWSALLYRQVEGRWRLASQTLWFWDRTYDKQVTLRQPNAWRAVKGRTPPPAALVPDTDAPFRVAVRYHWYPTAGAGAHDESAWVRLYKGAFAGPGRRWCDFSQ
jgi:hypothetical protein